MDIPSYDFHELSDEKRINWIRDLLFEYAEKPDKHQYMMDQILRLTCGDEDMYADAMEAGFENDWKTN